MSIVALFLKAQLLLIPVMLFYTACHFKKINPRFLWLVHRISICLFMSVPVVLLLMTYASEPVKTTPRVSPNLDLPREWIPDEFSVTAARADITGQNTIPKQWPNSVDAETNVAKRSSGSVDLHVKISDSVSGESGQHSVWSYRKLLYLIPLCSIGLFLLLVLRLFIQYSKERHLRKNGRREYFKGYPVYSCREVYSPFSTGILTKKIYVPWSCNSRNRREPVLNHEYAHLEGNHNLWSLLENIVLYLYWYNPFYYFFRKDGERLKELLADEYAGRFTDKFDYSRILIDEIEELNRREHIYIAAGFNKKKIMKERIMNLMNPIKRNPSALIKVGGILALALCIVLTTLIGCSNPDKISDPNDFSYVNISTLKELNDDYNLVLGEGSDGKLALDSTILLTGPNKELMLPIRDNGQLSFNFYNSSDQLTNTVAVNAKSGRIFSYTTDREGHLVVLSYDNETQTGQLERLSDDGSSRVIMRLSGLELNPETVIEFDGKDRLYLRNESKLHIFVNGKEAKTGEDREIRSMTIAPGGKLYYIVWDAANMINCIDQDTYEISSIETSCDNLVVSSCDDGLLVMDAKGIKKYKNDVFSGYIASSEDYPELIGLFNADFVKIDKNIYLTAWDFNSSKLYLYRLQITDQKRLPDERPPLTIQVPDYLYQSMSYAAKSWNKTRKDVRIEVSQYEDYDDSYEAYQKKLSTEILSGKGPDILFMSSLPWNDFIENGVLVDLNEFINKDSSFSTSDYLPALTAIKRDSGLYGIALDISDDNILFSAKSSVMEKYGYTGTYNDISWKKMIELAEAERRTDPNGMEIFPFGIPGFEEDNRYYISKILSENNSFLDPKTGLFMEQDFRSFLSVIDKLVNEDLVKPGISGIAEQYRSMEEGSMIFLTKTLGEFWVNMVEKKHIFNNEPVMIVHPNFGVEDLSFRTTLLGINNNSEHKEAAWDFLKTILTDEYQDKMFAYELPVNRSLLERRTLFSLRDPEQLTSIFSSSSGGDIEYVGAADYSDEELAGYFRNIERFKNVSTGATPLERVIIEQIQPYLDGDLSLDETIEIVKDRVNTYINE